MRTAIEIRDLYRDRVASCNDSENTQIRSEDLREVCFLVDRMEGTGKECHLGGDGDTRRCYEGEPVIPQDEWCSACDVWHAIAERRAGPDTPPKAYSEDDDPKLLGVRIRLTDEQRGMMARAATASGLDLSKWIRFVCMREARKP